MSIKRIAVVHRNCLFRDCLVTFLGNTNGYQACAIEIADQEQAELDMFAAGADVVLIDLNMPGNLAVKLIKRVRELNRSEKIIALVPDDHQELLECVAAGVNGCVMERSSLVDLEHVITNALLGETVCTNQFAATIFAEISRVTWQIPNVTAGSRLTARELEVLSLLASRNSNKQIAKKLSVSISTVKNHVHNILGKLEVDSRVDAVDRARQENLIGNL